MGLLARIEAEAARKTRESGNLKGTLVTSGGRREPIVQSPFTRSALKGTLPVKALR